MFRSCAMCRGLLAATCLLLIVLSACSQDPAPPKYAGRPTVEPHVRAEGPPCAYTGAVPHVNIRTTCAELLYETVSAPEAVPNMMGLALNDTGDTLYFARAATGEVWALPDMDHDGFPETPELLADGFDLPTALAWRAGTLYVLTRTGVTQIIQLGTTSQTLRSVITGWGITNQVWPGSIGFGPDQRLYVSLSARCTRCETTNTAQGVLLSYTPDGTDRRVEVTELYQPLDFAWHPITGELWIVDSAPLQGTGLDEIKRMATDGVSFPFRSCPENDETCVQQGAPTMLTFPQQSNPAGIAFYPYAEHPYWENDLIVVLRGSWNTPLPIGYAVITADFDDHGQPTGIITPLSPATDVRSPYYNYTTSEHSLTGRGFFPQHPYDVVVAPNGWLYISVEEGRIIRFRPKPAVNAPQLPS